MFSTSCIFQCAEPLPGAQSPFELKVHIFFGIKTVLCVCVLLAQKYGIMICLRQCWPLKLHLYSKCDLQHTSSSSELILLER